MTVDRFDLVEGQVQEAAFDLVVISVIDSAAGAKAVTYSQRLRAANADLPILVLSDNGLYLPKERLISVVQSGYPMELIAEIGKMLLESTHTANKQET